MISDFCLSFETAGVIPDSGKLPEVLMMLVIISEKHDSMDSVLGVSCNYTGIYLELTWLMYASLPDQF